MLPLLAALAGCGGTSATGTVTDIEGAPIEGATVTVIGTLCQTTTDATGAFELPCKPGEWQLAVAQQGFVSKEIALEATESKRYDLGKNALIEIPEGEGLFLLTDGAYSTLRPGRLARDLEGPAGSATAMSYCLDPAAREPTRVAAGRIALFDKAAPDWRVWKLDDRGCAYRKERIDTRWEKTAGERLDPDVKQLGPEQSMALLTLEPGAYFVARWSNGFFAQADGESEDGRNRYDGFVLVAE